MPPGRMLSCRSRIGRVQRAGDGAVLGALVGLAQIDQRDVGLAEQRDRLVRLRSPSRVRAISS